MSGCGIGAVRGAAALCILLSSSVLRAQDATHASMPLEAGAPGLVLIPVEEARPDELQAIAPGLAAELGVPVHVAPDDAYAVAPGETQVRVVIRGATVFVSVTRPDGVRVERAIELPADPQERSHVLIVLASNLARDQTSDLLVALRRSRDPGAEDGAASQDLGAEPSGETADLESADPELSATPDLAGEQAPLTEQAPAVQQDPWRHRLWRLGMGAHLGTAPTIDGVEPWALAGLDVVLLPIPEFGAGLRDVGVVWDGVSTSLQFSPVVELAFRPLREIGLHAIIGCDLQIAIRDQDVSFGVAPRLGLGARFYPLPFFSIAADVTARVVASDALHSMITVFPQGAVPIAFSTSFAFHL